MNMYSIVALAFGPGVFWLWYFYKKDKLEPEPKSYILKIFFAGMLVIVPVLAAECLCHCAANFISQFSNFYLVVLIAPIVEEYGKFFVVRKMVYHDREFDEPMDGIVYAAAAALGFASVENLMYLTATNFSSEPVPELGNGSVYNAVLTLSFLRAILSVPAHVLFSSMWGYALGVAKFLHDPIRGRRYILHGLVLSIVLHGIFNFLILSHKTTAIVSAILLLIFLMAAWRMVQRRIEIALQNSPHAVPYHKPFADLNEMDEVETENENHE